MKARVHTILVATLVVVLAASGRANDLAPVIAPANQPSGGTESDLKPDWSRVIQQALMFTVIQHGFRYATENGTRNPGAPFFPGYANAIEGLHGWSDGDPFLVNYIGHPLQGAVAARIWIQNDPKYRDVEIGRDSRYWKSRFRATAFAWVQSVQFEIGPLSEASIGSIQKRWPEQGFVDHVVTPVVGLGWLLMEDAVDKYLVRRLEPNHKWLSIFLRGGLNPSASFANVMAGKYPWHRQDRSDYPWRYTSASLVPRVPSPPRSDSDDVHPDVAPFELSVKMNSQFPNGLKNPCVGGGGEAGFRFTRTFQLAVDVGGCTINSLEANRSGDLLQYMAGPRWTPFPASRFSPFVEVLAGGQKITQQQVFPERKAVVLARAKEEGRKPSGKDALEYARSWSLNRFAWKAGAGVDLKLNSVLAIRLASVDYVMAHTIMQDGSRYGNGLQVSSGVTLRMGTW